LNLITLALSNKAVEAELEFEREREHLANLPPCLSPMTDAEAQPLTTTAEEGEHVG